MTNNAYLDIIIRSISVYFFMIFALRLFGKKELSQLNPADLILILLISNAVQNAMVDNDTSLSGGMVAAFALFSMNFIFRKIMLKYKFVNDIIEGKPEVLIRNGKPMFTSLAKIGISSEELEEAMREHGI
jgi:uncharacterized membrane protein YcaP (DUF421 family)